MIKSELYLNSKDIETKRLEFEISSMHKTLKDKKMQTVVNVQSLILAVDSGSLVKKGGSLI